MDDVQRKQLQDSAETYLDGVKAIVRGDIVMSAVLFVLQDGNVLFKGAIDTSELQLAEILEGVVRRIRNGALS